METLQRTANRGSISTGYDIDNSLKLESDNAEYLDNRHYTAGNRRTWTLSFWIKRTELGTTQKPYDAGNIASIGFLSTDKIQIENTNLYLATNRVFRDTSAWYHIVLLNDSTQSTASDRAKLWINGVQETSFYSETYMAQNEEGNINSATSVSIGGGGGAHVNGYMAELFFVDGQALAPTDFGEYDSDSGIWKPKEYDGTLSGTSIKLDFSNSAALWEDSSGLTGNGTAMSGNNITSADQATDTPTNNFATLNPLVQYLPDGAYSFITEGATKARSTQFDVNYTYAPTFGVTSGKWYAEFEYEGSQADNLVGILDIDAVVSYNSRLGQVGVWSVGFYQANGKLYVTSDSGTTETASWGASAADGDIIGVALDMDNYFVYFAKNGTWQNSGVPTSGATGTGGVAFDSNKTVGIGCSTYGLTADGIIFTNLGGYTAGTISSAASDANGYGTFEYAPPSGYYALCTKNLAEYG